MKRYKFCTFVCILIELVLILAANVLWFSCAEDLESRMYRVEASRVAEELRKSEGSVEYLNLSDYDTIVSVRAFDPGERSNEDYVVEDVNGTLYRIAYRNREAATGFWVLNVSLGVMLFITVILLWFIGSKIIKPFSRFTELPYEIAKGNLTTPLVAEKSRFFGKFLWGMEMLRENLEDDKEKELALHREKKTLILSLSHDIKTPLSAIKLYTKALMEELYDSREKREEALRGIADNTLGIEGYVNEIVAASREDFLNLEVNNGEFYLSEAMQDIQRYYKDKLSLQHTEFVMEDMTDCLVKGDKERVIEVLQNIMENAIKYGDGRQITIAFSEEEDCRLVSVVNTGSSIPESELVHIFDSFYRGSNADHVKGSGLGLYICRSLMHRMDGEVFAEQSEDGFLVTVVIRKAG